MRLTAYDDADGSPTATGKVFGKGSGKDGRPIVADLVRLRENESRLVQELANEKARAQAQLHAALAAQEAEFAKRKNDVRKISDDACSEGRCSLSLATTIVIDSVIPNYTLLYSLYLGHGTLYCQAIAFFSC
jgi:hypothetical protein